MCESLVDEFDPLRSSHSPPPLVNARETTPPNHSSSRRLPPPPPSSINPLLSTNPFENSVRPCRSETNISQLQSEHSVTTPTLATQLMTTTSSSHRHNNIKHRSQENLLKINEKEKIIENNKPLTKKQGSASSPRLRFPRERPQGRHLEASPSVEIDNPFSQETRRSSFGVVNSKFWVDNSDSELELIKVKEEEDGSGRERRESDSSLKKHASMDDLDTIPNLTQMEKGGGERGTNLDYNFRRMRSITSLSSSALQTTLVQSADHTHIPTPASVPNELHQKGQRTVQGSHAHSRSPRLFRKKVS